MKVFYLFYVFLTFVIGMISLGIVITASIETKDRIIRSYLLFHATFTLLVVSMMLSLYFKTITAPVAATLLEIAKYMTAFVAGPLFIVAIPVFVHNLFAVPHARRKNVVLAGMSLVAYSANHFFTSDLPKQT
jgi:hypothetical protein